MDRYKIDIKDIADLLNILDKYNSYANYLVGQGGKVAINKMLEYWENVVVKGPITSLYKQGKMENWNDINIHIVKQKWGSGSGGWQRGMSTSAFVTEQTVIIENFMYNIAYVFYQDNLAYVCVMDEKYKKIVNNSYERLPSYSSCEKYLDIIYKVL